LLALFAVTLFVSAALLFQVQLMMGKLILPRLGGTPAVWNTCMVFFQATLLAGYGYTHSVSTHLSLRRQLLVHAVLLFLPFGVFALTRGPLNIGDWVPPTEANPIPAVLLLLSIVVGVPFFVVATSAPLLQKWFSQTGHRASKDPYFLYGASNLGSMVGLLSYPFLVEPNFGLPVQTTTWAVAYGAMIVLTSLCGFVLWRTPPAVLLPADATRDTRITAAAPPKVETAIKPGKRSWRAGKHVPAAQLAQAAAQRFTPPTLEVSPWRRLRWVGLTAVPSSLMLGVTTFLTTDIAAIPLFWVIPLALYLLSFILVFSRWPTDWTGLPHTVMLVLQPISLLALGVVSLMMLNQMAVATWLIMTLHLVAFFLIAMVCHGELAKDRPSTKHLTEYYLLMSVGGVLGGMFNALLAPLVFVYLEEYVIAMVAACLLRPTTFLLSFLFRHTAQPAETTWQDYVLDVGYALCLGLFAYALIRISATHNLWGGTDLTTSLAQRFFDAGAEQETAITRARWIEMSIISLIPVVICLGFSGRPIRFGLGLVALLIANASFWLDTTNTVYRNRSFFGIQAVRLDNIQKKENDEDVSYPCHILIHGGIDHGRQYLDESLRDQPITYFYPTGPIGQIFTEFKKQKETQPFAVVGLGIGTLAAYARSGQPLTFYEIDPAVVRLSLPPQGQQSYFYYLSDAIKRGVKLDIVLGDGRLSLRDAPKDYYQIIVLDAFSSDAIPVHLLTSEAVDLYLTKLAEGGILIFNITNRYVDLEPTLGDLAKAKNLIGLYQGDWYTKSIPDKFAADWVVMAKKRTDQPKMACEALAALAVAPGGGLGGSLPWAAVHQSPQLDWPPLLRKLDPNKWENAKRAERPLWTDSYSNLWQVMRW
jgi:hypothetical protein